MSGEYKITIEQQGGAGGPGGGGASAAGQQAPSGMPQIPAGPRQRDPYEDARRRVEGEVYQKQVKSAYEELKPFDPKEVARERFAGEQRSKQVNEAYKKMFGGDDNNNKDMSKVAAATRLGGQALEGAGVPGGSAIASSLGAMAMAAGPIAATVAAFAVAAAAVYAFTKTVEYFVERGKELQPYSASLTAAGARSDVAKIQNDMADAEALGPGIARLTDLQTEIWSDTQDLLRPIKEVVVDVLVEMMTEIRDGIAAMREVAEFFGAEKKADKMARQKAMSEQFLFNLQSMSVGDSSDDPQWNQFQQGANAPAFGGGGGF